LRNHPVLFAAIIGLTLWSACKSGARPEEEPIARVYDRYLYPDDLSGIIPSGTRPEDSARLSQDFIDNWVKHHLLVEVASENLSGRLSEIERQAKEYRESLLIEAYLQQWVDQNLDTAMSREQIQTFYDENAEQFRLQETVYRIEYAIGDAGKINLDSVRFWLRNMERNRGNLDRYCSSACIDYQVNGTKWYSQDDLERNFPGEDIQPERLEGSDWIQVNDQDRVALFRVLERKRKGEPMPLAYCRTDINKRIMNRRHRELIKATYRDLYIEGGKHDHFEIY